MAYTKQNFVDGQTLTAAQLNHIEDGIANAAGAQGPKGEKGDKGDTGATGPKGDTGPGFTDMAKSLIVDLFGSAAYGNAEMQATLDALKTEWGVSDSGGGSGGTTTVPVTSVTLSKTSLNLSVGDTETLTATVLPSNATSKTVTWSVSPSGYATVSGGKVTATNAGSCTVTATAGGKRATCAITVTAAVSGEDVPGETPVYKLAAAKTFIPTNKECIDTGIKMFESIDPKPSWTILFDVDRDTAAEAKGDTYVLMHCMEETYPWPGFVVHMVGDGALQTNIYGGKASLRIYSALSNRNKMAIRITGTTATCWQNAGYQNDFTIASYNTTVAKSLLLGCYQTSNGTKGRFWYGTLYQCLVYQKALTDEQITTWLAE